MGHLTLKMLSIIASSLMVFALAQAENDAEKQRKEQEKESQESRAVSKKLNPEDRLRAEQSIKRALRDQERAQPLVLPPPPKQ